jgi:uncharacterized membrane protein YgcG
MFRTYLAMAFLGLGLHSYAQMKGWSISSEAEEFRSRRAAETESRHSGGSGGSGGRSSGSSSSSGGK